MDSLTIGQTVLVCLIFVWSGFVRTALGFGGAALSLPLFLFIIDNPVQIIPVIGIHLLIAVAFNLRQYRHSIDWWYLKKTLPVIIPFKIAGVIGLLNLPATVINVGVYVITLFYALSYISQIRWQSPWKSLNWCLLAAGGYISGTSLIGAPLIIAVYSQNLSTTTLRATLFCLWFILVTIKLLGFVVSGTDLNLLWAAYSLPFAWIGHIMGEKAHQKILSMEKARFMRWIGIGLLAICLLGLTRILLV